MSPDVSYIIAVYNGQRYLAEAIDSILAQTVPPMEVIVVDDGSTDGTAGACAAYGERIRYVYQDNAGHSAARNRGVELARAPFVAFLDADDLIHPRKLEKQLDRFAQRPELDFCHAAARNFWSPDVPESQRLDTAMHNRTHAVGPIGQHISAWLVRRRLFDTLGGFRTDMTFGEDTEWFERAEQAGAVMELMPQVLSQRRLHGENLTLRRYPEHMAEIVKRLKPKLDAEP